MHLMRFLRSTLALCFLAGALHLHAATYQFPELVRVVGADNKHIVGAVKSETGESLGVLDLKTGQTLTYSKASIRTLGRRLSDRDAAQACGSARLLAWKIQQVLPQNQIVGKVASLDQGTIYTTLNAKMGISKDENLNVYRVSKEIRDPDTGQVLDRERRKIAKLVVTEVGERVVKAKTADDLEIEIRVGDEVEPVKQSRAVAILPATDLAGNVRASGKRFSEELVSSLTELGVAVVERNQLDRVRGELALQQGAAFDGDTARQLGKLVGAFAVLTGTISDDWVATQNTLLRLVKVETGEVIFGAALGGQPKSTVGNVPQPPAAVEVPRKAQPTASAHATYLKALGHAKGVTFHYPFFQDEGDRSLSRDPRTAFALFMQAAEQGHADAMAWVASMHSSGDGTGKADCEQGIKWFEKSATAGSVTGMYRLARIYDTGGLGYLERPKNPQLAQVWLQRSAALGHPEARKRLAELRSP